MFVWPAHKASLSLTHNEHKATYRTVQQEVDEEGFAMDSWVSEEQKAKAIATDDCWILQWYPETPVGFCTLAAADLDVLLEHASKEE
jgi:hypothetical protein